MLFFCKKLCFHTPKALILSQKTAENERESYLLQKQKDAFWSIIAMLLTLPDSVFTIIGGFYIPVEPLEISDEPYIFRSTEVLNCTKKQSQQREMRCNIMKGYELYRLKSLP